MEIDDKIRLADWVNKIVDGDILRTRYLNGHFSEIKIKDWNPDTDHFQFKELEKNLGDGHIWDKYLQSLGGGLLWDNGVTKQECMSHGLTLSIATKCRAILKIVKG